MSYREEAFIGGRSSTSKNREAIISYFIRGKILG